MASTILGTMKTSRDRILTTHAGSIGRPAGLVDILRRKESGETVDSAAFDTAATNAAQAVIDRQIECGIDVINDGEQPRPNFHDYVFDRLPASSGDPSRRACLTRARARENTSRSRSSTPRGLGPREARWTAGIASGPSRIAATRASGRRSNTSAP